MLVPKSTVDKIVKSFESDYTIATLRTLLVVTAIVILVLAFTLKSKLALAGALAYVMLP